MRHSATEPERPRRAIPYTLLPYQPITTAAIDTLGGTRARDVAAQQAGWSKVLGLLTQLSR